ncbi:beta-1,6-N-acetylglucosaminyltransferase [Arcicella rigui]|uniref:Peptide O-xylosyltransferase n=1 Tax=Arcicella rigui TaxID=797020 RepID=A0ABU5QEF2_9BACT|nr:beta-1,6-N-acetylglucosaminyltransferase [Arcicella rigui]MEA5141216.1 beta-1,6-N-acetylglucosaminyltransferase [Arcicella rigui]
MKIAHLILVHTNPTQFKRLIERLAHPEADIYVHVDSKIDIKPFLVDKNTDHVFFIKNRISIVWGAYSMVEATISSFREILQSGKKYDYVNLLSGQDYPLRSAEKIHQFYSQNPGKAFMETLSVEREWKEAIPRLTKYHFTDYRFVGVNTFEALLNAVAPQRKIPNDLIPVGRSQWFTITLEHVKYIVEYLDANQNVVNFFKFTWGSDEIVFQTILYNSKYKKDIISDNLMYIDWSEGKPSPKTFTIKDLPEIRNSDKLFARKFNQQVDTEILNAIDLML